MRRWATLFALFIILIVVLADSDRLGVLSRVYEFPYGDKAGHFLLFGVLSLLVNLAVFEAWPDRGFNTLAVRASAILAVLIGFEELSQRWFPGRTSSVADLVASYAGVAIFASLAVQIERRKRNQDAPPVNS